MKLSKLECEVVRRNAIHGVGAYLQWAWICFPKLKKNVLSRDYPTKEHITQVLDRMDKFRVEFDISYNNLSRETTNPLQAEQEAWELLSPKVAGYLTRFKQFTDSYSPDETNGKSIEQFLGLMKEGWDLLRKWNTISKSNKPKYEMSVYKDVTEWDGNDIQQREKAVRELISELSGSSK